jgi:hypothetical protein
MYTIDEYISIFPRESGEFLRGEGIQAIENYDAKRIRALNTFSSIRTSMDALEEALEERYRAREHKDLGATARKYLEKAFLVANEAYEGMSKERRFRPDGTRFIFHPLTMAEYAIEHLAVIDPTIIAAILLHDVLEYTTLDTRYLCEQFGEGVAAIASDLAQNRTFETMPLEDVCAYLQQNAFVPFLQQIEHEHSQKGYLINLAIKNEQYTRLISAPKHPLSPVLKVLDTYTNYAWVRDLPISKIPKRSQEEIALFKEYIARCSSTYALPQVLLEDAYDVVARYENVRV